MSDYIWSKYQKRNILKFLSEGPMYIKTTEKYGDRTYLVTNEDDLVETMLFLLSSWNDCQWVPQVDWYFDGTYEEYFFKKMGFNHVWFQEYFGNRSSLVNHHMQQVAECGNGMKDRYNDNMDALDDARFIADVLDNGLANRAGQLYNLMTKLSWNDAPMFTVASFDTI